MIAVLRHGERTPKQKMKVKAELLYGEFDLVLTLFWTISHAVLSTYAATPGYATPLSALREKPPMRAAHPCCSDAASC